MFIYLNSEFLFLGPLRRVENYQQNLCISIWRETFLVLYKWIWSTKLPLKIKKFMWQLFQDVVLTRDNMKKRKWPGSPICSICRQEETANHLFFSVFCC
jgi:hypothetical protein